MSAPKSIGGRPSKSDVARSRIDEVRSVTLGRTTLSPWRMTALTPDTRRSHTLRCFTEPSALVRTTRPILLKTSADSSTPITRRDHFVQNLEAPTRALFGGLVIRPASGFPKAFQELWWVSEFFLIRWEPQCGSRGRMPGGVLQ